MFRRCVEFVIICLLSSLVLSCPSPASGVENNDVVIIFTNDIYCSLENATTVDNTSGNTSGTTVKSIGYSKIKGLKDWAKRSTKSEVALVDAGDFINGDGNENIVGLFSSGNDVINVMNQTGYDFVALGDKDTTYGAENLKHYMSIANFRILCSNIMRKTGSRSNTLSRLITSYAVKDFGSTKVAFIGVTTPEAANSGDLEDWHILDSSISDAVQNVVNEFYNDYRDFQKYVVVLSHLGSNSESGYTSRQLIESTNNIDLVIDGHSRNGDGNVIENCLTNCVGKNVYYGHCGRYGEKVGVFKIKVPVKIGDRQEISLTYMTDDQISFESDDLKTYISNRKNSIESALSEEIGTTNQPISRYGAPKDAGDDASRYDWSGYKNSLNVESFTGNLIADSFRKITGARIGVITAGGIGKTSISTTTGSDVDITLRQCYNFLDKGNPIGCVNVTGSELKAMIEHSLSQLTSAANNRSYLINGGEPEMNVGSKDFNGFLQVSGLRIKADCSKPSGQKVSEIKILKTNAITDSTTSEENWENIDDGAEYSLASTSYLLSKQGEGYDMFDNSRVEYLKSQSDSKLITDAEALSVYIRSLEHINEGSVSMGRITYAYRNN